MSTVKLSHSVTFGQAEQVADPIAAIKAGVGDALMQAGLPGAFTIDLGPLGLKTAKGESITGQIQLKPTISKKDGRVMYNTTGEVLIAGHKVKPMGNWLLPKQGFTVDAATHEAYVQATKERDAKRTANRGAKMQAEIDAELEAGESL